MPPHSRPNPTLSSGRIALHELNDARQALQATCRYGKFKQYAGILLFLRHREIETQIGQAADRIVFAQQRTLSLMPYD